MADNVVWSEGFGFADLENQVAARPDTVYRTASIGKPMTATAALKLAEQGKSGEELRRFVHDSIFEPAGMEHTRDDDPRIIVAGRARGYIVEDGQLRNSRWVDMSSKMAAGGWITTAPDLVRFMNAWMFGRLVAPQTMKIMLEPYRLPRNGGTVDNFGMGWFVDEYRGMRAGLYGGGTPQVSGIIFFVLEKRLAVAGIFNLEEIPGTERSALAESIADVVLGFAGSAP